MYFGNLCIFLVLYYVDSFLLNTKFRPFIQNSPIVKNEITPIIESHPIYNKTTFPLHWYVIGETDNFHSNKPYKITIWNKDYVIWKDILTKELYAMDDDCSHKGAALSSGYISKGSCITCPYHGYEFGGNGSLCKVPGLSFTPSSCKNQRTYPVIEKNGWIYLNTISKADYQTNHTDLFKEPEAMHPDFSPIFLNVIFKAYSRIITENSLDVMHIGFVHTFGNREFPSPISEIPPHTVSSPFHYRTEYDYLSGSQSFAKKVFGFNELKIQNEFALPHTTVARILFGPFVSTVVTFATPINITHSQLFVKTYRNFWRVPISSNNPFERVYQAIGDYITKKMMWDTVLQDKSIIEGIRLENADGKFNMKYDKLSNTYRTFYKKWIHKVE